jgi:sec-independent protein translocase protein TatA
MPGLNIGLPEVILILAIALIVLGPKRLPEVGASLGKSIREFRKAATEVQEATSLSGPDAPAPTATPATPSPPVAAATPEPAAASVVAAPPAPEPVASVTASESSQPGV